MASIYREFEVGASPEKAWEAIRDAGNINNVITFLGEVTLDGDYRTCHLGDEGRLNELIVSVDDERRRFVYSIRESPFGFSHHSASMQIVPNNGRGSRLIWVTDIKPDEAAPAVEDVLDAAVASIKETLN
jgi:carbon monoxide dehydrogenase subunit G